MTDAKKKTWDKPELTELDKSAEDITNGMGGVADGTAGRSIITS